jgi:hypothetical protein
MAPLIGVGEMIAVEPLPASTGLNRFDLIVFDYHDQWFCHYVWDQNRAQKDGILTTRSLKDCTVDDLPIAREKVLGRVLGKRLSWYWRLRIVLLNLLNRY